MCQHVYDVMGCGWNMPGNYAAGSFENCKGDSGEVRTCVISLAVFSHLHSWHSLWVSMEALLGSKGNLIPLLPIRLLRRLSAHRSAPLVGAVLLPLPPSLDPRVRISLWCALLVVFNHRLSGSPVSHSSGSGPTPQPTGSVRHLLSLFIHHFIADSLWLPTFRPVTTAVPVSQLGLDWSLLALALFPCSWVGSWL